MKQVTLQDGKKEDITKILNLYNGSFLFIGQKGTVVRNSSFLEHESKTTWDLCTKSQTDHSKCRKMRMSTFSITDATYLDVSRHFCISTSNRSLHFLHVTSSDQWETYRLIDMPTIPICLENNFKDMGNRQTCELFVGDHVGNIYIFTFLFPRTMLFDRKYTTEIQIIRFQDLKSHRDYVICRKLKNAHSDFVDKIIYVSEHNLLLSNAKRDSKRSLISQNLNNKSSIQVFRHKKGVTCFDTDQNGQLMATGSKDFLIRVWKLFVPHDSILTLYGHCAVVSEVRFWNGRNLLLSICKELDLKIWNMDSGRLLQSMLMNFVNVRRDPYLGNSVLHIPDSDTGYFLVTCSDSSIQIEVDEILVLSEDKDPILPVSEEKRSR